MPVCCSGLLGRQETPQGLPWPQRGKKEGTSKASGGKGRRNNTGGSVVLFWSNKCLAN